MALLIVNIEHLNPGGGVGVKVGAGNKKIAQIGKY